MSDPELEKCVLAAHEGKIEEAEGLLHLNTEFYKNHQDKSSIAFALMIYGEDLISTGQIKEGALAFFKAYEIDFDCDCVQKFVKIYGYPKSANEVEKKVRYFEDDAKANKNLKKKSEVTDGDDPLIGEWLKELYQENRDLLQSQFSNTKFVRNHARFTVFWMFKNQWHMTKYKTDFTSGWYDHGNSYGLGHWYTIPGRDKATALAKAQADFLKRGIEMNADMGLKFCQSYAHSEQGFMSCISCNKVNCADKFDIPEFVILQVVSLEPVCPKCKKMFKSVQDDVDLRREFLHDLFPSFDKTQNPPPLTIFFHTLHEHYDLQGIDLLLPNGPKFIEDILPRPVLFGEHGLVDVDN